MEWSCSGRLGIGLEILEIHLFLGGLGEGSGIMEILIGGAHWCDLICGGEGIE